jgi:hypothetical protein
LKRPIYPPVIVLFRFKGGSCKVPHKLMETSYLKLFLDPNLGEGGSTLTIGGKLQNYAGVLEIGPPDNTLSAPSTVEADKLANGLADGGIRLYGSATAQATLDVGSAAGFGTAGVVTGVVFLSDDAIVEFARGQITTIAASSTLELYGSHASVADASNTSANPALAGLKRVGGELHLEDGATVTNSGGLSNSGAIILDGTPGNGGCLLALDGTLTNSGTIQIGPGESTLKAAKVVNDGAIDLNGGKGVNATLTCGGLFTNDGSVDLDEDTETIAGAVGGIGDFTLSTSTLEFVHGVSNGETVTFASPAGYADHLILDSPSSFEGTIEDFTTAGDSVTAKGFAEAQTMLTYTQTGADSCSWTLTQGAQTAVLNFAGATYAQSDFSISPSANGAVLIKHV